MFNFALIESELQNRAIKNKQKREKYKIFPKPSKFGQTEFFRRYKKVKLTGFTHSEPPKLKQSNPFEGESGNYPDNRVLDHKLRRKVSI